MRKLVSIFTLLCSLSVVFFSCASVEPAHTSGAGRISEPAYVIRAKRDSGFVSAYKAHFAVDGNSITKISASRYEDLTLGSESNYKPISATTCAFDVVATTKDPTEWTYTQNEYDTKHYAVQSLIWDLKQMKVSYTGTLYVLVTFFDEYKVLKVANLDGMSVLDESYAMFRNDEPLSLSKDMQLGDLRDFYKHK